MTDNFFLDWAVLTVSFFNAILLSWLGLTVLLNAERRNWGIWLAGGGLLLGALFFISHTAILGMELIWLSWRGMVFWWTVGLAPAIILPFSWYTVMLWYAGFWVDSTSVLHKRQRPFLIFTTIMLLLGGMGLAAGVVLLVVPSTLFSQLRLIIRWSLLGVPLLVFAYSFYVVLCITLSLDTLLRPGPSARVMGEQARERARPWLIAASVVQLIVSLMVAGVLVWLVDHSRRQSITDIYLQSLSTVLWVDLVVAMLIATAVLLLGQAVVSYELFTGKSLPHRGLARHWRMAILSAGGFSLIIGGSIAFQLRPIYSLLLATLMTTAFLALSSRQSYVERERYIDNLRPFISSQRLYDQLLTPSAPLETDINMLFHTLCRELLGAKVAYLAAVGPLSPLVGPPLTYGRTVDGLPFLTDIAARFNTPTAITIPIDPLVYEGAIWAVPLWSARGLIGVFFLGAKQDGGLYAQEEMEIARISGERLIDTQASVEMARRLMAIQRERLAHTQIIDQQTRRTLHDDILPVIHTAMIALDSGQTEAVATTLTDAHKQISDLLHEMPTISAPDVSRLGLIRALQNGVNEEFAPAFDDLIWEIDDVAVENAPSIPNLTAETVFYAAREAVRNAAKYGRGEKVMANGELFTLCISVSWQGGLQIIVEDNGVGMGSTPLPTQGGGQGLALHSTMMAVVGGELTAVSSPDQFTRVTLFLPTAVLS